MATLSRSAQNVKTVPNPTALYAQVRRILYLVAGRVRQAVRLKLEGRGHEEAVADELVNDAFVCVLEALPRWNASKGKFTTFAYGLVSVTVRK
jgi:hypothetical protein